MGLSSCSSISPGCDPASPGRQNWHMGALLARDKGLGALGMSGWGPCAVE